MTEIVKEYYCQDFRPPLFPLFPSVKLAYTFYRAVVSAIVKNGSKTGYTTFLLSGPEFLKNDIRITSDLDALGALGDTGWYCTRAILWANEYELPKRVTALPEPEYNEACVILSCGALLRWTNGKTTTFYCSFLTNLTMDITSLGIGTNGYLRVHDFVIPFQQKGAPFYEASNSRFAKLSIEIEPVPSEHVIDTDLP
ncbi:unnamed protein product [Ilex paraguariensis]|uniref:Uncharacterized protein n=1 Tax=Ilex paraguariensis TaxID=185542 RepID=A0ABC8TY31_9AQUA